MFLLDINDENGMTLCQSCVVLSAVCRDVYVFRASHMARDARGVFLSRGHSRGLGMSGAVGGSGHRRSGGATPHHSFCPRRMRVMINLGRGMRTLARCVYSFSDFNQYYAKSSI